MEYNDFYQIAVYGNENWRGFFTQEEIAENAYIYKTEHDASGSDNETIKTLIENLEEDLNNMTESDANYSDVDFWLKSLKEGK